MTTFELTEAGGRRTAAWPTEVAPVAPVADEHRLRQEYIDEINVYVASMVHWHDMEPDEVLLACSAYSARLSEMRVHLQRRNSALCKQLLNREVDPLLSQIEFQFRIHSRLLSARELDLKMSGGQT